jgi:hypothetical protein
LRYLIQSKQGIDYAACRIARHAVNFTSLGYGDVVMSERWRLLGALEAGSGILMFGVSTASFFAVIMRLSERRLRGTHDDAL